MGRALAGKLTKEKPCMATGEKIGSHDPEFVALGTVYDALSGLDAGAQQRVIDYVVQKLSLSNRGSLTPNHANSNDLPTPAHSPSMSSATPTSADDELEGISPVAKKWMTRNGLTAKQLSSLFSLGADEIDLVAKTIPGKGKRERTRTVLLLKAVAAYLSSGAARVSYEQIKEASLHYDAYDSPNHAKYLKSMNAEASGSKESGYTLTPRGLTSATETIKEICGKGDAK
jgi:hypothetical protein